MTNFVSRPRRLLVVNFVVVFLLGLIVAKLPAIAQIAGKGEGISLVYDVERMLIANFVDKPDPEKLTKGAIDGMLESLDDPYAEYVPADEAADFEKAMTGSFSGIGCQIDVKDGWLYVVSPLEESPAFNAGILAGDRITKVDGKSTQGKTTDQCIKMITGQEGTPVRVDVQRNGQDMMFELKRAKIVSKSVQGFRRRDDAGHWEYLLDPETKIAYVRMRQFTPTAPQELFDALDEAGKEAGGPLGGLILDLRYNPGGLMDAAIEIVDKFVDEGRIMSTKGRNIPEVVYKAEKSADTPTYPIAILVNGLSASASEIVSGSLSENLGPSGRVIVIGTRTFGKGLVQSVQSLPHDPNAIVKFTTQHYYLPSGKLIQRTDSATDWGVDPTQGFFVPLTDQETTAYLLKRSHWDVLRKPGTELPAGAEAAPPVDQQHWSDPDWILSTAKDKQLAGAVKTMEAKVKTGAWAILNSEPDQHGHILMTEMKKLERDNKLLYKQLALNEKRMENFDKLADTGKSTPTVPDLWPDSLDLTGGLVEVKDKDGKVIADLTITGRDLERWLAFADVEKPKKDDANTASNKTSGDKPPAEPKQ